MDYPISIDTSSVSSAERAGMALERELNVYDAHLVELLANEGKYVLICGEEISGAFDSYEQALDAGHGKYGLQPFLVKQINRAEPIHYFSRDLPVCRS